MVPGVHHPPYHSSATGVMTGHGRAVDGAVTWAQGLLFLRVEGGNNVTSVTLLLELRSSSPGHQDQRQLVRGKCWIASRSPLDRASQAPGAWPGHPQTGPVQANRGLPFTSRIWDPENTEKPDPSPNKTESISALLAEPAGPGKVTFS